MLIPAGYGQLNFKFTGQAVPTGAEVTVGFTNAESQTIGDVLAAVATSLVPADFASIIENDSQLATILVKLGPNDIGPSGEASVGLEGDAGSDGTVPNVAALVTKFTELGGRAGRGRLYWPFVMASWVDDAGTIGSGTVDTITECWNNFAGAMDTAGLPLTLLHGADSPIDVPTPISGFLCQATAATQRRRLRR